MNVNEIIARQLIDERVAQRAVLRRAPHPKTTHMLRRLAERADRST